MKDLMLIIIIIGCWWLISCQIRPNSKENIKFKYECYIVQLPLSLITENITTIKNFRLLSFNIDKYGSLNKLVDQDNSVVTNWNRYTKNKTFYVSYGKVFLDKTYSNYVHFMITSPKELKQGNSYTQFTATFTSNGILYKINGIPMFIKKGE